MPHFLQAGPVRVRYENGFLRYFSHDENEILRMVYLAVRDHNWLTARITLTDESIEQLPDSFRVHYRWSTDDLGIQMDGQVTIQGNSEGTITIDFYGKALNAFQKNRIGLCVLHPIEGVLGQPAELISPEGQRTRDQFPVYINPHQPFLNLRSMRWRPASGLTWQLDFSGDIFETEDQRNWTDASFKTYSTPNDLPKPVAVSPGDEFRQRVEFRLADQAMTDPAAEAPEGMPKSSGVGESKSTRPLVGAGQRTDGLPLTAVEATLLKKLNLAHLRADVFFSLPNWQLMLTNAIADTTQLSIPLELAVFFGEEPVEELRTLQGFLRDSTISLRSVILYDAATLTTSDALLQQLVPILRTTWPTVAIGGGTDDNFVALNRNPFNFEWVDFIAYSINPQVHAFDDLTLLENIAGQVETVRTAQHISGNKPVHISPVTLRPRFVTVAGTATERLTVPADPRQTTEFGADWTRQSLNALIDVGVASVTYYQSHGPGGLVDGEIAFPVYSVFDEYQNRSVDE